MKKITGPLAEHEYNPILLFMTQKAAPFSPLHVLALQWQVLGLLAVAVGRQISLATKMRSRAGVAKAEMLEAWLYAAIVKLARQIAAHEGQGGHLSPGEARALDYLKTVYTYLSILALLITQMRRDLARATAELTDPHAASRSLAPSGVRGQAIYAPPFLDSG